DPELVKPPAINVTAPPLAVDEVDDAEVFKAPLLFKLMVVPANMVTEPPTPPTAVALTLPAVFALPKLIEPPELSKTLPALPVDPAPVSLLTIDVATMLLPAISVTAPPVAVVPLVLVVLESIVPTNIDPLVLNVIAPAGLVSGPAPVILLVRLPAVIDPP